MAYPVCRPESIVLEEDLAGLPGRSPRLRGPGGIFHPGVAAGSFAACRKEGSERT